MTPKLRTIFYHSSLPGGQKTVKNPAGWKKTVVSLERSETYHSLIEQFKASNLWYGNARETLLAIQASDGANAEVRVTLEVKWSELGAYEIIFDGLIKLAQFEEIFTGIKSNKLNAPIIRDGFWSKFHNRYDRPVNLEGTTDLDGNARAAVSKIVLPMPSQKIRVNFEREIGWADNITRTLDETAVISYPVAGLTKLYILFSNALFVTDEVENRYEYGSQFSGTKPTDVFKYQMDAKYTGVYTFSASLKYLIILSASRTYDVRWFRAIKTNGVLTETQIGSTQSGSGALITDDGARVLSLTESLNAGDEFYLWGEIDLSSAVATASYFPDYDSDLGPTFTPVYTEFSIQADTVFEDTTTDAYLVKEAAQSIISKYVGADSPLISTKFSNTTFNRNAIFRGKHNRGYSFSEKEMSMSFKNWWEAANPAFNLCLGYTKVLGVDKIYIEDKSYAYNPTPIVNLPNARNLVRRYDLEKFFSSIEFGFEKWSAESASGIDDHQTKRIYNNSSTTNYPCKRRYCCRTKSFNGYRHTVSK